MENIFYNTIVSTPASTPAYILMPAGEAEGTSKVFFLVWEKIPVGSEKSGFWKYRKYRPKYR
jgi:hypothetical protein